MSRIVLFIAILVHGSIHIFGFIKAYHLASINQLQLHIGKMQGIIWLTCFFLFIVTAIQFFIRNENWWIYLLITVLLSQILIILNWDDAKFGSIVNALLLLVSFASLFSWNFENEYQTKVNDLLRKSKTNNKEFLREADIMHLPDPVKKYVIYSGSLDKPKIYNFKSTFEGKIRKDEKSNWMPFTSEQHNLLKTSVRLFFMKALMKHLPVAGFHCFIDGIAYMDIRLFSIFKVQYQSGNEMNIAETVTFFNDMCVMAPASLIDPRIIWLNNDSNKVQAKFTNNNISITAWLYFNEIGELINFISDDRYAVNDNDKMLRLQWSTPMKDYKIFNGYKLASYADAIYRYPEGEFCYGSFNLKDIEYNVEIK